MKHILELNKMLKYAKDNGLKRLKIGSLEVEFSDIELATQYSNKVGATQYAAETVLTPANTDLETPPPTAEASPTALDDQDDGALLFHSSI